MKVAYVVSDLSYPPREGLHQQTLILIGLLIERGVDIELHGYVKSLDALDEETMYKETGIRFATSPVEQPGSLLWSATKLVMPFSKERKEMLSRFDVSAYDVLHFEGIAACALASESSSSHSLLSFVDPGSRRNFRFTRTAERLPNKAAHLGAGLLFLFLERHLRRGDPTWHVVSAEDRLYLERLHRYSRVVSIPVALPAGLTAGRFQGRVTANGPGGRQINVLVYADLRQPHMRQALKAFAEGVFQQQGDRPPIKYVVLGRAPVDAEMASWFEGLNYEFIQWADDYLQILSSADLVVLPDMVGTGLKNRAVQSMASGVAVLGTSVAFEGLSVESGRHAFVVRAASDARIPFNLLVSDASLRSGIGAAGRSYVMGVLGPEVVARRWEETYSQISHGNGPNKTLKAV